MNAPITLTSCDSQILAACRQGDEAVILVFFEKYKDLVYSAIHKWISQYSWEVDRDEVSEIFQEVMIALMDKNFKALSKARDPDKLGGLIFIISFHGTGRYFKKKWKEMKKSEPVSGDEPVVDDLLDRLDEKIQMAVIEEFVSGLKPIEQEIFELRFGDDMEYGLISGETGLSISHVGVIISRLKGRLKKHIQKKYKDTSVSL